MPGSVAHFTRSSWKLGKKSFVSARSVSFIIHFLLFHLENFAYKMKCLIDFRTIYTTTRDESSSFRIDYLGVFVSYSPLTRDRMDARCTTVGISESSSREII